MHSNLPREADAKVEVSVARLAAEHWSNLSNRTAIR